MTDYTMPIGDDVIQGAELPSTCVTFGLGASNPSEVIRIDAQGFHYRGQFIEDAGEAHRLLVEFLRQHQPTTLTMETSESPDHPAA